MRGITQEQLEAVRPSFDALCLIEFCLDRLYEEKKRSVYQSIVRGLTFEELIGTLLKSRDEIEGKWVDDQ